VKNAIVYFFRQYEILFECHISCDFVVLLCILFFCGSGFVRQAGRRWCGPVASLITS